MGPNPEPMTTLEPAGLPMLPPAAISDGFEHWFVATVWRCPEPEHLD